MAGSGADHVDGGLWLIAFHQPQNPGHRKSHSRDIHASCSTCPEAASPNGDPPMTLQEASPSNWLAISRSATCGAAFPLPPHTRDGSRLNPLTARRLPPRLPRHARSNAMRRVASTPREPFPRPTTSRASAAAAAAVTPPPAGTGTPHMATGAAEPHPISLPTRRRRQPWPPLPAAAPRWTASRPCRDRPATVPS
jgi:hypothetical protein